MQQYNENILLYKTNSDECKWFMGMAQKCGILKHFTLSCVDGKDMQFRAMGIEFVPVVILKGTTSPIQGKEAMTWLQTQINAMNNSRLNQPINNNPPPQNALIASLPRPPINNMQLPQNMPPRPPTKDGLPCSPMMPANNNPHLNHPINNQPNSNGGSGGNGNGGAKEITPAPTQADKRLAHRMGQQSNHAKLGGNMNATAPPTEIKPQQPKTTVDVRVPLEYRPAEMSGISDTFAYTKIDDPQPKSFLSPTETCNIFTGREGERMNNDELQRRIRDAGKTREGDKKNYEMMIEQENKELVREINQPPPNEMGRRR
jgi:hypothetical protein